MKTLATLCVALSVAALAAADDKAKLDAGKLVGDWTYVSGVRAGEKVDKERLAGKVTVTKDTFTLPAGPQDKFVMAYKVDAKAAPTNPNRGTSRYRHPRVTIKLQPSACAGKAG